MYPFKPFCISMQAVFFVWNSDLHLIWCRNDLYVVSSSWGMEVSGARNIMSEPTTLGSYRDILKSIWLTLAVDDQRNLCFPIHVFRALSAVQYWLAAPLQYRNTQSWHSNQASTNAMWRHTSPLPSVVFKRKSRKGDRVAKVLTILFRSWCVTKL